MATQTRISEESHQRLVRIARDTGRSLVEVIDIALMQLERELFLDRVNAGYAELRSDPKAWAAEMRERKEWDATLSDGMEGDD